MDPLAVVARLVAVGPRPACSNGERLAARQAVRELRALGRRGTRVQTEWVRPAFVLVAAGLAAAGVAASVLSVDHPTVGAAVAGAAVLLLLGEVSGRAPLLSRLSDVRATQNVISVGGRSDAAVRLIVTATLDTPRGGLLDGDGRLPRAVVRTRRALRGHLPGRHGVLLAALVAIGACAGARMAGIDARWLGILQLVPTLVLLALAGLLTDAGTARATGPGASANASAAAVALALVAALDRRPPRALAVDLVLAGAGEAGALGMRRWIAEQRRRGTQGADVAVLHVAACGQGTPVWWTREGRVLALGYHPQLTRAAARTAAGEAHLRARPHESRTVSGARAARAARWPAIAVGALDASGTVPRAGHVEDTVDALDPRAMSATLTLALGIVAALDAELAASG